jgi:hypothetical protein
VTTQLQLINIIIIIIIIIIIKIIDKHCCVEGNQNLLFCVLGKAMLKAAKKSFNFLNRK